MNSITSTGDLTQTEITILTFLRSLPPNYMGSVTLHFDGKGPAKWEQKYGGTFTRPEPLRRVVVRAAEE